MPASIGGLISLIAQSFSRMKAPARGLISLFSHKVHSFFGKPCGAGKQRVTQESPKTTDRGCKPDRSRIGIFPQAAQPSHTGQRPMRAEVSAREPADPWSKSHERPIFFPTPAANAGCPIQAALWLEWDKWPSIGRVLVLYQGRLPSISCIGLMSHGTSCGFPCEKTARADLSSIHVQEIEV